MKNFLSALLVLFISFQAFSQEIATENIIEFDPVLSDGVLGSVLSEEALGSGSSGGGVGHKCKNKIYLADTFEIFYIQKELDDIVEQFEKYTVQEAIQHLIAAIEKKNSFYAQELSRKLKEFKIKYKSRVEATNDHHIKKPKCRDGKTKGKIIQLARQDGRLLTISKKVKKMSIIEQASLRIHEAKLGLEIENNTYNGNTTDTRNWVKAMTKMSLRNLLSYSLTRSIFIRLSKNAKQLTFEIRPIKVNGHHSIFKVDFSTRNEGKTVAKLEGNVETNDKFSVTIDVKDDLFQLRYKTYNLWQNYSRYNVNFYEDGKLIQVIPVMDVNIGGDLSYNTGIFFINREVEVKRKLKK